jgi:hypothetical protein
MKKHEEKPTIVETPATEHPAHDYQPQPGEVGFEKHDLPMTTARTIKAVTFKKNFTPQLIAMAHERELLCQIRSEIYTMELPVKGRTETMQDANVVDVLNVETGMDHILILNVMMHRALTTAAVQGTIVGRYFACKSDDMVADKRYRAVNVVEVEVEFEVAAT